MGGSKFLYCPGCGEEITIVDEDGCCHSCGDDPVCIGVSFKEIRARAEKAEAEAEVEMLREALRRTSNCEFCDRCAGCGTTMRHNDSCIIAQALKGGE